ncbi:MAG: diguanylate cyclase, partial [bacterium]|nr:diguanylate cyclase [bacterium]
MPMRFRVLRPTDEADGGQPFANLEELLAAREQIPGPVLVVASKEQVGALLEHLRDEDDVCLAGVPPVLIARQLARLQATATDSLTGVANRQSFVFHLEHALAQASPEAPVSLLLIDIDHFKAINDQHGHAAGDEALCLLARLLSARAAFTGRMGGDEFSQVLRCGASEAARHSRALIEAVRSARPADLETSLPGHAPGVTVSIGAASAGEALPARDLLYHADEALYAAKARGRDRAIHADQLTAEAIDQDQDVALRSFDDFTRVITERVVEGITRRGRRVFQELKEQADVDTLTELKSRRYMDRRLPFELERARTEGRPLTVAMLDIDHFGDVNKTHGWLTGDRVLSGVAA